MQDYIAGPDAGYLLLVAGPIFGKSAFITYLIRSSGDPIAHHFIKSGQGDWDVPELILESLTAQLRWIFALPARDNERNMVPAARFNTVLDRASKRLDAGQRTVVLVDGLDEAFGPHGRFTGTALPGVFPRELPAGIRIVLRSRPGEHLNWLADHTLCRQIAPMSEPIKTSRPSEPTSTRRTGLPAWGSMTGSSTLWKTPPKDTSGLPSSFFAGERDWTWSSLGGAATRR